MMNRHLLAIVLVPLLWTACKPAQKTAQSPRRDDGRIQVTLLHFNDVYEINPLENRSVAGLARVAHLERELSAENPNTFTVHAGDFLSPSAIGLMKLNGEAIRGRHMVEVMDAIGVDLVTFGNHEFDLKEPDLLKRLDEGHFQWISANVRHVPGPEHRDTTVFRTRGTPIPPYTVRTFRDADGTEFRLGFIAVTIDQAKPKYVAYEEYRRAARRAYLGIRDSCDAVVAITHLEMRQDSLLALELPEVPLFMGGHDHANLYRMPTAHTRVAKADANAKTVYVHRLTFDRRNRQLKILSELVPITGERPEDPVAAAVVDRWNRRTDSLMRSLGFDPQAPVFQIAEPLDARESVVRFQDCRMNQLVAQAYGHAFPEAECALVNTGSIRVDDVLTGQLTEFDVQRILPFGGKLCLAEMKGELLRQVVAIGRTQNVGKGGFLSLDRIEHDPASGTTRVNGADLDPARTYRVALPEYLLSGDETNLKFLKKDHPGILRVVEGDPDAQHFRNDARKALIIFLRKN
jgi:2',3'-cyclic-nucleotide 2'-phosphodiesterase (5'-nucleotidase family)